MFNLLLKSVGCVLFVSLIDLTLFVSANVIDSSLADEAKKFTGIDDIFTYKGVPRDLSNVQDNRLYNANRRTQLAVGHISSGDRRILDHVVYAPHNVTGTATKYLTFPDFPDTPGCYRCPNPPQLYPNPTISAIRVLGMQDATRANVRIVWGGVDDTQVLLEFTSLPGRGIHSKVIIYVH